MLLGTWAAQEGWLALPKEVNAKPKMAGRLLEGSLEHLTRGFSEGVAQSVSTTARVGEQAEEKRGGAEGKSGWLIGWLVD